MDDSTASPLVRGAMTLDVERRVLECNQQRHHLTPKESQLLEAFLRHEGQVLTRQYLMKVVWDTDYVQDTRTLEVHVHWLRQKIDGGSGRPSMIHTVRGVGYVFRTASVALVPPELEEPALQELQDDERDDR